MSFLEVLVLISFISLFPALDTNVEEGEGREFAEVIEEEDQGHCASQGKPPFLYAYLGILYFALACFLQVFKSALFYLYRVPVALKPIV